MDALCWRYKPVAGGSDGATDLMACLLCQAVVHELDAFASNQSSVARVIAGLQHDCGNLFNRTLREACDALANDAVELLPFIDRELSSLAWDDEVVQLPPVLAADGWILRRVMEVLHLDACRGYSSPKKTKYRFRSKRNAA